MNTEIYENHANDSRITGPHDICPTLSSRLGSGGMNTPLAKEEKPSGEYIVRRITPLECERLQGFPDNYTNIPWLKGQVSDSHRYKALGNSMAVPVMKWIGERIEYVLSHPIMEDKSDKIPYQLELF